MYYALIILSVIMFGGCFALNDVYQKMRGSSLKISLQFSLVSSLAGLLALLVINKFQLQFDWFTVGLATVAAFVGFGFSFCGFRALGTINLSLYSLFSMLGGMALPFVQGVLFYKEGLSVAKVVCFVLICIALFLTVEKGEKNSGTIFYVGIFVLNGMSGVLSKIFNEVMMVKETGALSTSDAPGFLTKEIAEHVVPTTAEDYSIWIALISVVVSALLLLLFFRGKDDTKPTTAASIGVGAVNGMVNRIANLILVIALVHVDASVQYPMVTGGVMIVSTLICFFGKNKPSKKELASVAVAFIGLLALFAIPV